VQQSVPPAELFVIEPVMSAVAKMAGEDLPAEATFLPDDLPTQSGMLHFPDPLPLPEHPADYATTELDTIVWQGRPGGVMVISWPERSPRRAVRSVCLAVSAVSASTSIQWLISTAASATTTTS
jgi:hypothetical protein